MKKILLLLLIIITLSCSSNENSGLLLASSTCELPCWNNIVPGETTLQEAVDIIEQLDGINQESIFVHNPSQGLITTAIWFSLESKTLLDSTTTQGEVSLINDRVVLITLGGDLNLTFGDIVRKIGEPEYIISTDFNKETSQITINAIYPSKGISYISYKKPKDKLTPSSKIANISFFDSIYYEVFLEEGWFSEGEYGAENTKKIMYEWNGYGSLDEKYPPRQP